MKKLKLIEVSDNFYIPHKQGRDYLEKDEYMIYAKGKLDDLKKIKLYKRGKEYE